MHGNAVRVCLCEYWIHRTYIAQYTQLNWIDNIDPDFFLLCAANYIVQGENKWHVHFLLSSSSSLAVTAAAVPVASITIAATTAAPTTALAAQSAASTRLLPLVYAYCQIYSTKLIPNHFFVSVCLLIRSFEYRWFYFTVCFTHDRFEKSFIVWSELQQCSHSFNNTSSEFDGHLLIFLCISNFLWKVFEEKPVAASSSTVRPKTLPEFFQVDRHAKLCQRNSLSFVFHFICLWDQFIGKTKNKFKCQK